MTEDLQTLEPDTFYIKPSGGKPTLNVVELWKYRELLYFLAWRDVKVRYKQTILGVIWVLLQPILTTLIFTILFARFAPSTNNVIPYPLLVFCGFVLWTFTSNAITNAANSLTSHTQLITKVYFPRLLIPLAAVAATLLDLALGLTVLPIFVFIYGGQISWTVVLTPIFIFLLVIIVLAAGTILAALNVSFRDVRFVLPFALQILFFISPVFYELQSLPDNWKLIWKLNPLAGILQGFRAAIFGTEFDVVAITISVVWAFLLLIAALIIFERLEENFADLV